MQANSSKTINSQDSRDAIQAEMRKLFLSAEGKIDETMFIYEVIQYELIENKKYIVYLDNELCVDYRENGDWPQVGQAEIYHKLKLLENLPDWHFSRAEKLSFRRQLAEALVARYDERPLIADLLLDTAERFYSDSLRRWTFLKLCGIFSLYVILFILVEFFIEFPYKKLIAFSLAGSYLSFVTRGWKKWSDNPVTDFYAWIIPYLRILWGTVSASIVLFLFSCQPISPNFFFMLTKDSYGSGFIVLLFSYAWDLLPKWLNTFAEKCEKTLRHISASLISWDCKDSSSIKSSEH